MWHTLCAIHWVLPSIWRTAGKRMACVMEKRSQLLHRTCVSINFRRTIRFFKLPHMAELQLKFDCLFSTMDVFCSEPHCLDDQGVRSSLNTIIEKLKYIRGSLAWEVWQENYSRRSREKEV